MLHSISSLPRNRLATSQDPTVPPRALIRAAILKVPSPDCWAWSASKLGHSSLSLWPLRALSVSSLWSLSPISVLHGRIALLHSLNLLVPLQLCAASGAHQYGLLGQERASAVRHARQQPLRLQHTHPHSRQQPGEPEQRRHLHRYRTGAHHTLSLRRAHAGSCAPTGALEPWSGQPIKYSANPCMKNTASQGIGPRSSFLPNPHPIHPAMPTLTYVFAPRRTRPLSFRLGPTAPSTLGWPWGQASRC